MDIVMRLRAVWMIGAMVAVSQAINMVVMYFSYRGFVVDHAVGGAATASTIAVIVSVRWCKNLMVYALTYGVLLLAAVLGTAIDGGINSAALPFLALGPVMTGFMAGRRAAITCWAAACIVLAYLYHLSLSAPSMVDPFDYTRETNRFFQTIFAVSVSAGISVLITEQIYGAMAEMRENARRAQEAEAVKSQFLATLSHELRTPLNGVIGLTDALLEGVLAGRERMLAETIRKSGESLLLILNDLLDLSKIEAGKLSVEPHPTDLRELVRFVADHWRETAAAKGLAISVNVSSDAPATVMVDDLRLRQILQNLVSNAVKFTDRGCVSIAVSVVRLDDGVADLYFRVADTGRGVPAELADRIFDPFEQGEQGTARHFGGTGLGLPICCRLAALMGGSIRLEQSGPGGSTFLLNLPARIVDADAGVSDGAAAAADDLRGLSVLVVEDNEVNRLVAGEFLKAMGAVADFAHDGSQCLAMLAQNAYDVIIMDKHMPGMSGVEATAAIRASGARYAGVPIVAATADALPGEREAMLAAGMDEFVSKPLRADNFKAAILRALKMRKAA